MTSMVTDNEVEIASAAFSDDECVICGKLKSQHNMGSGYAMCMCYPLFVSKREMFKQLAPLAASDRDALVKRLENCFRLACDYTIDERAARSEIANQARAALIPLAGEPR